MPLYTYRRQDGTTFEIRQRFLDDPLEFDPDTGQHVVRLVQPSGLIFKGSGFYVNDSKGASKKNLAASASNGGENGSKSESKRQAAASDASTKPVSTPASSSAAD